MRPSKRLEKELVRLADAPPGVRLSGHKSTKLGVEVELELRGAKGTLYEGELFALRLLCDHTYPFECPSTYFIIDPGTHLFREIWNFPRN